MCRSNKQSDKKRLNFESTVSEFETPESKRPKTAHVSSGGFARDLIHLALAGDSAPLQEYIDAFDMKRAHSEIKDQSQWEKVLPAWKGKEKRRGLKTWASKTARWEWSIVGVCAKVINKAVHTYMEICGLPPVVEGDPEGGPSVKKDAGIDLFKQFLLTVHLAYCKYLNPEVERGMVAFDKVLYNYVLCSFTHIVHTSIHVGSPVHEHTPRAPQTSPCGT